MEEVINGILIREVETKNIMTKSSLPVGGYSVNPYVGCTHACKYCYASFMKRFTGHTEEWGTFLDVKHWPEIKNPKKYAGQRVVIGSVTDGYNPQEEQFGNTRKLLEQLIGSDADILICTKSDLVVRDIDLLKKVGRVTVVYFAGVEFYLTFQIDVSCGQDSFIKVRIQSSHGHIEFWMIRYNLIWRLSLKNQGRDDHIFLMQFVSGHVYTGPGL